MTEDQAFQRAHDLAARRKLLSDDAMRFALDLWVDGEYHWYPEAEQFANSLRVEIAGDMFCLVDP